MAGTELDKIRRPYDAREAARLLGVSPRRVRQLVREGVLVELPGKRDDGAVLLDPEMVHRERSRRKESRKASEETSSTAASSTLNAEDLAQLVERAVSSTVEALRVERVEMLAIRDRTEEALRTDLEAERAARLAAEIARAQAEAARVAATEEVERLRVQLEEASAPRRRWWGRS